MNYTACTWVSIRSVSIAMNGTIATNDVIFMSAPLEQRLCCGYGWQVSFLLAQARYIDRILASCLAYAGLASRSVSIQS